MKQKQLPHFTLPMEVGERAIKNDLPRLMKEANACRKEKAERIMLILIGIFILGAIFCISVVGLYL